MGSVAASMLFDPQGRPVRVVEVQRAPRRTYIVASGAPLFAGEFQWDDPPELRGPERRHEIYRKMAQSDAYIAEVLRDNSLPLLSRAVWDIAPGVEVKPKPAMLRKVQPPQLPPGLAGLKPPFPPRKAALPDPDAEPEDTRTPEEKEHAEIAELVGANLYRKEGDTYGRKCWISTPWSQRLREILKFLENGFALFHKRSKVVDGVRVWDHLLWLEPGTVTRWIFDSAGNLQGVERRYRRPDGEPVSREEVGAEELALYVWDMVGMRVEGTPLIRPMFGAWKRKEFLLRCKMIAAQRAGVGLPWAKWEGALQGDDADVDKIEKFLQSGMGSGIEHQYLALPIPSLEMGYLKQDAADLTKFDRMNADENLAFAHGGSTKSGMQGETANGSRSAGEVQQLDKYVLVEAVAQIIGEQDQGGVAGVKGLIEELVEWNYGELDRYPYVRVSNIDPNEPTRNIPLLKEAVGAGIVKARPQLEKMVLDRLGFELPEEAFEEEEPPPGPLDPAADPNAEPADDPAAAATDARKLRNRVSLESILTRTSWRVGPDEARRAGLSRQPTVFEDRVLALGVIRGAMQEGDEKMASIAKRAHRRMIDDLVARGRAGKISKDTLGNLPRSKPKGEAELLKAIRDQFIATATTGRRHVREELDRQQALAREIIAGDVELAARIALDLDTDGADSRKPEIDKPGGAIPKGAAIPVPVTPIVLPKFLRDEVDPVQVLYSELAQEARATAQITVDSIWRRVVNEAVGEYQRLYREGVEGDDLWTRLEAHLQGLSEKPLDALGRQASTVAYDEGRDLGIMEAVTSAELGYATRTAILDDATCEPCVDLDMTTFEAGSEDYYAFLPPARCKGDELCRCIMYGLHADILEAINAKRRENPGLFPKLRPGHPGGPVSRLP